MASGIRAPVTRAIRRPESVALRYRLAQRSICKYLYYACSPNNTHAIVGAACRISRFEGQINSHSLLMEFMGRPVSPARTRRIRPKGEVLVIILGSRGSWPRPRSRPCCRRGLSDLMRQGRNITRSNGYACIRQNHGSKQYHDTPASSSCRTGVFAPQRDPCIEACSLNQVELHHCSTSPSKTAPKYALETKTAGKVGLMAQDGSPLSRASAHL